MNKVFLNLVAVFTLIMTTGCNNDSSSKKDVAPTPPPVTGSGSEVDITQHNAANCVDMTGDYYYVENNDAGIAEKHDLRIVTSAAPNGAVLAATEMENGTLKTSTFLFNGSTIKMSQAVEYIGLCTIGANYEIYGLSNNIIQIKQSYQLDQFKNIISTQTCFDPKSCSNKVTNIIRK